MLRSTTASKAIEQKGKTSMSETQPGDRSAPKGARGGESVH